MDTQASNEEETQALTSRIFIRGLPPTIKEAEFQKHFAARAPVTDVKLFPNRRIGYVGFQTSEDAQDAIKYFNKSYIRTSKIYVEAAVRPTRVVDRASQSSVSRDEQGSRSVERPKPKSEHLKRKRDDASQEGRASAANKDVRADDPKLKEYLGLMMHPSRSRMIEADASKSNSQGEDKRIKIQDRDVQEYSVVEEVAKYHKPSATTDEQEQPLRENPQKDADAEEQRNLESTDAGTKASATDADWMRSRTSRLLGLLDDDEEQQHRVRGTGVNSTNQAAPTRISLQQPTPPPETVSNDVKVGGTHPQQDLNVDQTSIKLSGRLFLRNLSYTATEADLEAKFSEFGDISEVHVAVDSRTGSSKGMAFIQFEDAEHAVKAFLELDGEPFQGRLLHILPAEKKREEKLDEVTLSKLPLKKQKQMQKRSQAMASTFNWNSLYMNADAITSSISDRLGVAKSELFDPTSSDAAVKQAVAETHVIQETKKYFESNGVDLDAFKKRDRDDSAILVKNFSYGVKAEELKKLFGEYGDVTKVLMPPSGTIAIVQFAVKTHAQEAFKRLAYRKHKDSVLFLEKAPKGVISKQTQTEDQQSGNIEGQPTTDGMQVEQDLDTTTLFIRNLNFVTTNERLLEVFKPLDGLRSVRIKTKPDSKNPGATLSMGFGFAEFDTKEHAQSALVATSGFSLDGHELVVKASNKGADAADERRRSDRAKRARERSSKIIIKNLPFEATNKDVRNLFRTYGQLRAVRVPKKFDNSRKGFAFAEFTTPKEAENALAALQNTHLLGRRLVLDYAAGESDDPEEELRKMQSKISKQSSKVAMQKLTSTQRKRFEVGNNGVDEEGVA